VRDIDDPPLPSGTGRPDPAAAVQPAVARPVDPLDLSVVSVVTAELAARVADHAPRPGIRHLDDEVRRASDRYLLQQPLEAADQRGGELQGNAWVRLQQCDLNTHACPLASGRWRCG